MPVDKQPGQVELLVDALEVDVFDGAPVDCATGVSQRLFNGVLRPVIGVVRCAPHDFHIDSNHHKGPLLNSHLAVPRRRRCLVSC